MSEQFTFWSAVATFGAVSVLLFLIAVAAVRLLFGGKPKAVDPRFADRELMSLDEFFDAHYAARSYSRALVADVVTRFARAAGVPAGLVHPEDSFAVLNAHGDEVDHFVTDTASALKEAESKHGVSVFEGQLVTLDDYIRAMELAARLGK